MIYIQKILEKLDHKKVYAVFIPSTPNPTTGFMVLAEKQDLTFLDISVEEGMKLVLSGGIIAPTDIKGQDSSKDFHVC